MGPAPLFRPLKNAVFSGQRQSSSSADVNDAPKSAPPDKKRLPNHLRIYPALSGTHSVRLLTLHPAPSASNTITCTLTVHNFDEAIPRFTALSYTWGSPNDPQSVLLNGYRVSVTANLHVALMHLRSTEHDRTFWIDALCINQARVHERGQQVSLMRDIYMVAEEVLVWLGPAKQKDALSWQSRVAQDFDTNDALDVYMDIASRPYWTRVWIIQEFVLGRNIVLQCGHVLRTLKDFDVEFPAEIRQAAKQRPDAQKMRRLFDLKKRYKFPGPGLDIGQAIKFAASSHATDPRDKVYGVLGLVGIHARAEPLKVDYSLSPCEVYRKVVGHLHYQHVDYVRVIMMPKIAQLSKQDARAEETHDAKQCDGLRCGALNKVKFLCSCSDREVCYCRAVKYVDESCRV